MRKKLGILFELFMTMMKIGLFTIGGGYAMIAVLENEFVAKKSWLDKDEFLDIVAMAESTPGPIAINAATYIGYRQRGMIGSVVATVAMCIPSFVIIYVISLFLDAFLSLTWVSYAFKGVQACVVYIIFSAGVGMLKNMQKKLLPIIIVTVVTVCMVVFSVFAVSFSTIFYILISGTVGVVFYLCGNLKSRGGESQ